MICQRKTTQVLCKNRIHTTKPLTTLAWKTTETKRLETNFVPEFEEGDDNEGGKATPAENLILRDAEGERNPGD